MVQEMALRIEPLTAIWAARYNQTSSGLRDRWRVLYEMVELVRLDFPAERLGGIWTRAYPLLSGDETVAEPHSRRLTFGFVSG